MIFKIPYRNFFSVISTLKKILLKKLLPFLIFFLFSITERCYAGPDISADTVCLGNATQFTVLNTAGVTSVFWDFGDFFSGDTSHLFSPIYNYSSAGVYSVKLIFWMGAFTDSVIKNILVLGIPTPGLPPDFTLCNGTYGLNANYPYGENYLWSTGATTQGISYSTPGTYWIVVTNMCGIGTDTATISFLYVPNGVLPVQLFLCPGGDTDTLIAGPDNGYNSYQWTSGETTNSIVVNTPGSYFVQVNNMCGSVNEYCNVYSLLPPEVELGADDTIICGGVFLYFNAFLPDCPECEYLWFDGETIPTEVVQTEADVWLTITNECGVASDTMKINSMSAPSFYFGNDTTICNDGILIYTLGLEDGSFLWQDGSTNSSYVISETGEYYVAQSNYCGTLTDTINVKKLTLNLNLVLNDSLLCRDEKIILDATQPEGIYLWSDGSTDSTFEISSEGIYSVAVSNYCGVNEDTVRTYYENCNSCLHIPTAFSPNNDGHNDLFRVMHDCQLTNYELRIYSRWGQEVFSTTDPDARWNGKFIGTDLPIDVYTYQLHYSKTDFVNETSDFLSGNITLLR